MSAKVGLTGGIGSGKSAAAAAFSKLDVVVLSADQLAREFTTRGSPYLESIVARFGRAILTADGSLNRQRLGRIVFADAQQRRWLEQLLHPPISDKMQQLAAANPAAYSILEIPLLVESGQYCHMQRVVVVHCEQATRLQRLLQQRAMSRATALGIIQTQASEQQRLAVADDVIDNNADLASLAKQVGALHRRYQALFG